MQVTEVKLQKSQKEGIVKAFGKATLNDEVSLDVLIMDKGDGNGAWATFPNGRKGSDGKYYLPVFFKTKELDQQFKAAVIAEYDKMPAGSAPKGTPAVGAQGDLPF